MQIRYGRQNREPLSTNRWPLQYKELTVQWDLPGLCRLPALYSLWAAERYDFVASGETLHSRKTTLEIGVHISMELENSAALYISANQNRWRISHTQSYAAL